MLLAGRRFLYLFGIALFGMFWMGDALAQQPVAPGCVMEPISLTGRQTLRCEPNVTIVAESGAQYTLLDRDKNGRVDAANLETRRC